jgi:hypothetical protein
LRKVPFFVTYYEEPREMEAKVDMFLVKGDSRRVEDYGLEGSVTTEFSNEAEDGTAGLPGIVGYHSYCAL